MRGALHHLRSTRSRGNVFLSLYPCFTFRTLSIILFLMMLNRNGITLSSCVITDSTFILSVDVAFVSISVTLSVWSCFMRSVSYFGIPFALTSVRTSTSFNWSKAWVRSTNHIEVDSSNSIAFSMIWRNINISSLVQRFFLNPSKIQILLEICFPSSFVESLIVVFDRDISL